MMNRKKMKWNEALVAMVVGCCMVATAIAQSDESSGQPPKPPTLDEPSNSPQIPIPPATPDSQAVSSLMSSSDEDEEEDEEKDATVIAPAPETSPASSETLGAEVLSGDSFDVESVNPADTLSKKLLGENTPEWVKKGLLFGDEHRFAISSSLFTDLDQCRDDLRNRMLAEVQSYLDKHVLKTPVSSSLQELTLEYVEKFWLNQKQEFDNVQTRDGVVYHQLWVGLQISADQLKMLREWESKSLREKRAKQVGALGGIGIAAITVLSGLVGVLARREKAKLKA